MSLSDDLLAEISPTLGLIRSFSPQLGRIKAGNPEPATALGLTSFGVRFDLSANDVGLLRDALLYLPPECKRSFSASVSPHYSLIYSEPSSRASGATYRLYRNGRALFTASERREFLERFRLNVARCVAEASRRRTFIRAGVVEWGNRAILIIGPRLSGTTTLVAELVRAGATYYSDEYAVADKRGLVYPYALPMQLGANGSRRQPQSSLEEFVGGTTLDPIPVGMVIFSRYRAAAQWRPKRLSLAAGVSKILDSTISASRSPAIACDTLTQLAANAAIVRGVRGEASQMVDWVAGEFAPQPAPPQSVGLTAMLRRTGSDPGSFDS